MKTPASAFCLTLLLTATLAKTIPAAQPSSAVAEKKTESVAPPPAAPETTETPSAAILLEDAEEPKQADRAKKSATTTFCVEIRPGPSDAPVKVCDDNHQHPPPPPGHPEPQVPQIHQEIHHHDYPPPPHGHPEPQVPQIHQEIHHHDYPPPPPPSSPSQQQSYAENDQFYVVPPNPLAVFIPNEQPSFGPCSQNVVHHQNTQIQVPGGLSQHIIIPSQPAQPQHIYIPSSPAASQQILIPSSLVTGGGGCPPCPSANGGGHHPHALISLFRSAMAPNEAAAAFPMDSGMETMMRSSGNAENWIGGAATEPMMVAGTDGPDRILGSDNLDSPFARTLKKLHPVNVGTYYGQGGYQAKTPYIVQCNPQVLALGNGGAGGSTVVLSSGRFRDAAEGSAMSNAEEGNGEPVMTMGEPQNLGTPQRHLIHPMLQPIIHTTIPGSSLHGSPSVYQHSASYQTYQSQLDPVHSHSGLHSYPGYSVHHHPHSGILPPAVSPYFVRGPIHSAKTWNYQPASNMQRTSSNDMAMQQQQSQQQQQQLQGKWNQQANTERASMNMQQPQQSQSLSPSQMLNQMRGTGGSGGAASGRSDFERTSPIMMQTFPRVHDEKSCKEGAVHVNMHIPPGGQPFVIGGPRSGRDEKSMEMRHEEMGKRETEKSATSEKKDD